ncbi:MAG: hypothetical protein KC561_01270, partial [Myxococcales bacterium]|nr:hypothetical protein [Myxococcales bacterium]
LITDQCLSCTAQDGTVTTGCQLADFSDEAPLNPANIAECLFLSESDIILEPLDDVESSDNADDFRFAEIDVFNGCSESLLVEFADITGDQDAINRYFFIPEIGTEAILVESTFFASIDVLYTGFDRPAGENDAVQLSLEAYIPSETGEDTLLGRMLVSVMVEQ